MEDSIDRILEERIIIAQMAASELDGFFLGVFSELAGAHEFAQFDPLAADLSAEIRAMAHIQRELGSFTTSILFLDAEGRVVMTSPAGLYPAGEDLSGWPYVSQALEESGLAISEPFLFDGMDHPVTAVSAPIYTDDGRQTSLLIGIVELNGIAIRRPLERAAKLGHTGHATLIDSQGRSLAATLDDVPLLGQSEHPDFYPEAMAMGQPAVSTTPFALTDINGETQYELHVMALAPLSTAPWGIAVGGDEDDTFAGVRRLRVGLILLAAIALSSVWGFTLIGTRRLIKPVQQLTNAALNIAQGKLNTPLPVSGSGEIGLMTTALAQMQAQMLTNINELSTLNERLEDLVDEKIGEIRQQQELTQRLLRYTITAQEEERTRLARELHDEIGQMLMAIELSLGQLHNHLPDGDEAAQKQLERSRTLTEKTMLDLRDVIAGVRPGVLDQLGLIPAFKWLGKHILYPAGITISIESDGTPDRLPETVETTLFRIAQEAVSNVVWHSQASHLTIQLQYHANELTMILADNGVGFVIPSATPDPDSNRGLGLASMQERASLAGGDLTINSSPGNGTIIQVKMPAYLTGEY